MLRLVGASFRKLELRDQDLDHGVVDHLFGEETRDTGEENIHTVERTHVFPKELTIKATQKMLVIFKTLQDDLITISLYQLLVPHDMIQLYMNKTKTVLVSVLIVPIDAIMCVKNVRKRLLWHLQNK